MSLPVRTDSVRFHSTDGVELVGDLALPERPVAAAIVCHPHPQYGGNRHNMVVDALFRALTAAGIAALRFDFRPAFDHGRGESLDAMAALDTLQAAVAGPDGDTPPLVAIGYSFGAMIVLGLTDTRIASRVLVAPPLAMAADAASRTPAGPTLVLTPAHDQFSAPDVNEGIVADWPDAAHQVVPSTDHSLTGRTADVAVTTLTWLATVTSGARHQM